MRLEAPDYVVLVVEDLDRSLRFYTELLGLELRSRSGAFAQLETGQTRLALYERSAMAETLGRAIHAPDPDAPGFEIGFVVSDVDAAYAELVGAGAAAVTPPADRPWGQRTGYIGDPDGHLVELVQLLDR